MVQIIFPGGLWSVNVFLRRFGRAWNEAVFWREWGSLESRKQDFGCWGWDESLVLVSIGLRTEEFES
jgi:hypothetical protein